MIDVPDAWEPAAASAALRAVTTGRLDGADEFGAPGLIVVDLDGRESGAAPPHLPPPAGLLPIGFGWIVVGVSRLAASATTIDCDIALSTTEAARRPWVTVDDLTDAVATLRAAVDANPAAALTAAQLLRRGGTGPPHDDLFCESLAYATLQGGAEFRRWLEARPRRDRRPPAAEPVLVERDGGELRITLNRPEVRNAYDAATRDALVAALQLAVADRSVRRVELAGAGPAFCSGGDLDEFGTATDPPSAHLIRMGASAGWWLAQCAAKVTARLHGACVGAGIELPAFAGRVEAGADTRIRLPEVGMGLVPGAGGTASIPRRIGRHRTAWMAISGVEVSGVTALRWGLVDAVDDP
ncbi:enoyl-CoA hydratase/isomerase family protein [Acidiferrimicrobium sp. IK]|uniref:enoyl-CoA hydratase/isomerase family protein n=1 Tax=Acidiferrimicrobium sp. IK TaxID=2871700 RepID=UPI0021CB1684|nr:enoyl-CoA hydratase/isomerase family protein [Acidiferrimicrobium sp. IK]MCU4185310.1 enoyl-CoA hydratase/isomerase family protein [Acidiferrimicrobium sp. IK]